ncbi:hypothetical protein [Halolactibacillus halophilus]|nr:hypothetical protein [Halolactibacillus halophilus]
MIISVIIGLAFSQVHIAAVSLLFVREIGFYLFLFVFSSVIYLAILFGFRSWDRASVVQTVLAALATVLTGGYTILLFIQDRADPRSVDFSEISLSFSLIVATVIIYFIGTVALLITAKKSSRGLK